MHTFETDLEHLNVKRLFWKIIQNVYEIIYVGMLSLVSFRYYNLLYCFTLNGFDMNFNSTSEGLSLHLKSNVRGKLKSLLIPPKLGLTILRFLL